MPEGIGIVDLMIGFPHRDRRAVYDYLRKGAKDRETREEMSFLAEYMFKDVPGDFDENEDPVDATFAEMDRYGIEIGLFGLTKQTLEARDRYPGRVPPAGAGGRPEGVSGVRDVRRARHPGDRERRHRRAAVPLRLPARRAL